MCYCLSVRLANCVLSVLNKENDDDDDDDVCHFFAFLNCSTFVVNKRTIYR